MIAKLIRRSASVVLLIVISGCVAHLHTDLAPPADYYYHPPKIANPTFDYTPRGRVHISAPIKRTRFHEVRNLWYPSSGHNGAPDNDVHAIFYKSRSAGRKKLVIVLPIWGTSDYPPSRITRGYARHSHGDADLIWILGKTPLFPWTELSTAASEQEFMRLARDSAERYRSAVIDIRRLLDWASKQPDIKPSQVGIVGFSMSALVAATTLANDDRISAAVLMMAGADYANIFSKCGNRAGEVRAHVLSSFGWTLQQYHDFFAKLFGPADPVNYPGRFDPTRILMIDAAFDDCMPHDSREALWDVTGHPERITLLARHRSGFFSLTPLGLNFIRRRIYDFLDMAL